MKLLDLFSGIGGFSLGLERSGFETIAFCEIVPFRRKILNKHWPKVPCYHDIRELTAEKLRSDGIFPDAISAGFPCQDISIANGVWGDRLGLDGERSGLWSHAKRLIGDIRPIYVVLENVREILSNGLLRVLRDLAALGYDAEWRAIPASYLGCIQNRDRVWIVAYPSENGNKGLLESLDFSPFRQGWSCRQADLPEVFANPFGGNSWPQPLVRRGNDRPANWVDRIAACGDAVVPQIPEAIGRSVLKG